MVKTINQAEMPCYIGKLKVISNHWYELKMIVSATCTIVCSHLSHSCRGLSSHPARHPIETWWHFRRP
jgi:hypothetical protein